MRLIDADTLKMLINPLGLSLTNKRSIINIIDSLPTVESPEDEFKEKVLEVFNKYDVLVLHIGDKLEPVKNTSKQDCYNLIYDIGELIEWRRVLFKKYHGGVDNG